MNEDEMDRLFASYRDALGTCGRTPPSSLGEKGRGEGRRSTRRLAWALAAGMAAVLTTGVALWPTESAAGIVRRMEKAILNARTMEVTFETRRPGGAWRVFDREYTRDGMWRHEAHQGSALAVTYIFRDGRTVEDYRRLDHATIAPGDRSSVAPPQSALDYAKESIDSGQTGIERTIQVRSHVPWKSVPTYALTLERAEDGYHGEILVDARNDLPIMSEYSVRYPDEGGRIVHYRQTYRFDRPLPDALFTPSRAKPLIDVPQAVAKLESRWAKPLAHVGDTDVRDACVTEDGTVWISVTFPRAFHQTAEGSPVKRDPVVLPAEIVGRETYARLRDLAPATMIMGYAPIRMFGDDVIVVGFVPLDPDVRLRGKATVRFANRAIGLANEWSSSVPPERAAEEVVIPLRTAPGDRPEFFSALLLDHFGFQLPPNVLGTRVSALRKAGRELDTARANEAYARAYAGFIPRLGAAPLEAATKLYEKLGRAADAARTRAEAAALKAGQER